MKWEALIAVGRILADLDANNAGSDDDLSSASLRKAVSVAYYAMFNALAQNNADRLVGASEADRASSAWNRTYRALEHRTAYRQLRESQLGDFSNPVRVFGSTFRTLQGLRHRADYDPRSQFSCAETLSIISEAESAIADFLTAPISERRDLAAHVLFTART